MAFSLAIPTVGGHALDLVLSQGEVLFVLGPNGSGKSALMHKLYQAHSAHARRISAHRQTWFTSNAITLSPEQKRNTEQSIKNVDTNPEARWKDDYANQRASIAIYDLCDAENVRARAIAQAVDGSDINLAKELAKHPAPVRIINDLLRWSSIPIELSIRQNEQVVASKNGSQPYSITQLSDGERNALLIAANVLTVDQGTLVLIDEPERHLHRSIISPLLTQLFAARPDCAFVVSTHDVMLPIDNPTTRTLLVRGCTLNGGAFAAWDADLLDSGTAVDESVKKDILGGRRTVIFIEGTDDSLDKPLYSLLFPGASVIPKSSCRDVENAVGSIRDSSELHWLRAFGVVDGDGRSEASVTALKDQGIYSVAAYSVESLYYDPEIQRRAVERHATVTGDKPSEVLTQARTAALEALSPHKQRLSERAVERLAREELFRHLPRREAIASGQIIEVKVDTAALLASEVARLDTAIQTEDLATIIRRYPIRETPALDRICDRLGFKSRRQYERSVLQLLIDDPSSLDYLRTFFKDLLDALNSEHGAEAEAPPVR